MLNPHIYKIDYPDCYLWLTNTTDILEHTFALFLAQLNKDNIERYHNFLRKERQKQFLLGRILLKKAVATFLSIPENEINIIERPDNKPRLILPPKKALIPFFSIAHSGIWVGCAVGKNAVGLDIEIHNPVREPVKTGEMAFNSQENEWLKRHSEKEKNKAFYQLWTRKEALYKLLSETGHKKDLWQTANIFHKQYAWHLKTFEREKFTLSICGFKKTLFNNP